MPGQKFQVDKGFPVPRLHSIYIKRTKGKETIALLLSLLPFLSIYKNRLPICPATPTLTPFIPRNQLANGAAAEVVGVQVGKGLEPFGCTTQGRFQLN